MARPDRRQPLPTALAAASDPARQAEALRWRIYLGATLIGSAVLISVWVLALRDPDPDLFVLYGHPALLVMCVWAVVWLLQRRSLLVAERVVFVVNALAILAQMALSLVTPQAEVLDLSSAAYWMLVAVSILSYLLFSTRGALWFSAGFYAMGVALPWTALIGRGQTLGDHPELARVQLICGAILVLLYSLAWYRERFILERGHRLTLEELANTDPLTHLPNRRALYPAIERLLAAVHEGVPGCLILFDLDHFKRVNDTYGHNAGDEVLIGTAELFRETLRGVDRLGRWGGEEFLLVLPGVSAPQGEQVAERLRALLAAHTFSGVGRVTASFGVAACAPGDDLRRCIARADTALYRAKAAGRDRVELYRGALPVASPSGGTSG